MRILVFILLGLLVSGCGATKSFSSIDHLKRTNTPPRIVLLPTDITLYEQTTGGMLEVQADWTTQAEAHISKATREYLQEHDIAFDDDFSRVKLSDMPQDLAEIIHLHTAVGESVIWYNFLARLPHKDGAFDWTLGPDVQKLARHTNANYGLFIYIHDIYASTGRKALIVAGALLGVTVRAGQQYGYASLVDLKTGDVVWFNRLSRDSGDVRDYRPAKETVDELLGSLPR